MLELTIATIIFLALVASWFILPAIGAVKAQKQVAKAEPVVLSNPQAQV